MKKLITIRFKDETKGSFALFVDSYCNGDGIFQLFTYGPNANTHIRIFPLVDIEEIDITEGPEVNII